MVNKYGAWPKKQNYSHKRLHRNVFRVLKCGKQNVNIWRKNTKYSNSWPKKYFAKMFKAVHGIRFYMDGVMKVDLIGKYLNYNMIIVTTPLHFTSYTSKDS